MPRRMAEATREAAGGARDRWIALALFAAATALYLATRQDYFFGDGRGLIDRANSGGLRGHNLAYLPLAQLARALCAPFAGADAERALYTLSAVCAALAVALSYAMLRTAATSVATAVLAALLVAVTPVVWFHGTCIEVLAPHLLIATAALWLLVRAAAADRLRGDALVPAVAGALVVGSHMSGALWVPALAWIALCDGRARVPRRLVAGLAVALAIGVAWYLSQTDARASGALIGLSTSGLFAARDASAFSRELARPLGVLCIVVPLAWLALARARATLAPADRALAAPSAIVVATYVFVVTGLALHERGAYYIGCVPWLAWVAARGLEALPRGPRASIARAAVALALALQAGSGWSFVREIDERYPRPPWIDALVDEIGADGVLLARTQEERVAVLAHSRLQCFALHAPAGVDLRVGDLTGPDGRAVAAQILAWCRASGRKVALTRSLLDAPDAAEVLRGLDAQPGRLTAGMDPRYSLLATEP